MTGFALNNAEWCAAVCRAHGIATRFDDRLWWSPTRTPPLYPDAVTLARGVAAEDVLSRVDTGGGCSVKDSFADLELAPAGFRPLFRAEWVRRDAPPGPVQGWSPVTTADELRRWGDAWGAGSPFVPALLAEDDVRVLARRDDGRIVAGAIANRSTDVLGLSNVFDHGGDLEAAWRGAAAAAGSLWPGLPLGGYASGQELDAAQRSGFATVGELVVWAK